MSKLSLLRNVLYTGPTGSRATGALFLFHGTGSNAYEFKTTWDFLSGSKFQFPHIKIIYPSAPLTYFSAFNEKTTTWFDVTGLSMEARENEEDLRRIFLDINALIAQEVESGIPINRIAFGGFSRGAAMSLHTAFRLAPEAAGVVELSGFIPDSSRLYVELNDGVKKNARLPPLLAFHGREDDLVNFDLGLRTFDKLTSLGVKGEFVDVPRLSHSLNEDEYDRVRSFVNEVIPEKDSA